jgi:hypothetical protein
MDADITIVLNDNVELVRKRYGASTDQKLRNIFVHNIEFIHACISIGRILRPKIDFKCLGGRRIEYAQIINFILFFDLYHHYIVWWRTQ